MNNQTATTPRPICVLREALTKSTYYGIFRVGSKYTVSYWQQDSISPQLCKPTSFITAVIVWMKTFTLSPKVEFTCNTSAKEIATFTNTNKDHELGMTLNSTLKNKGAI